MGCKLRSNLTVPKTGHRFVCNFNRNDFMNATPTPSDPNFHAIHIRQRLDELVEHLRADVEKVKEPKAQALFETTAEVLKGLSTAFEHYGAKSEKAWQ
jgi:hypothetical protein